MTEGQVAALLLWLVLLIFSLRGSLLRTLHDHPLYQHLCLGGAIALVPLWTLRAGLHEGLEIHFLGLTSLTLLLGWRLALLAGTRAAPGRWHRPDRGVDRGGCHAGCAAGSPAG